MEALTSGARPAREGGALNEAVRAKPGNQKSLSPRVPRRRVAHRPGPSDDRQHIQEC